MRDRLLPDRRRRKNALFNLIKDAKKVYCLEKIRDHSFSFSTEIKPTTTHQNSPQHVSNFRHILMSHSAVDTETIFG